MFVHRSLINSTTLLFKFNHMHSIKKWLILFVPASLLLGGCYFDKEEKLYTSTCATTDIRYSNIVKPIVDQNCSVSGCHNTTTLAGGYDLTTYSGLKTIADNGQLLGSITHASGFSAMPQGREKLSDCQISQIRTWVDGGALNN